MEEGDCLPSVSSYTTIFSSRLLTYSIILAQVTSILSSGIASNVDGFSTFV